MNLQINSDDFNQLLNKLDELNTKLDSSLNVQPQQKEWLDIQETCKILKVSIKTLSNYRTNGILPFSQIGAKIYFKASDIQEHLNKHYVKAFKERRSL